jgi:hypothetical protein
MLNFLNKYTTKNIGGLFIIIFAAVLAGCTAQAETSERTETPAPKKEVATAQHTPADAMRMTRSPYSEMPQDGDFEYATPAPSMPKTPANLNKAAFEKIRTGMTLAEVEKLLGEKGMLVSTMDVNGRKTQIYKWSNDNFSSYIDVTIEKEKVVEKKDKGLK